MIFKEGQSNFELPAVQKNFNSNLLHHSGSTCWSKTQAERLILENPAESECFVFDSPVPGLI